MKKDFSQLFGAFGHKNGDPKNRELQAESCNRCGCGCHCSCGCCKGDTGPIGPQGPAGATGAPGEAATIQVGTVITGNPGTNAGVTNSGNEQNAVLNFVIPRGDTGPTGATGAVFYGKLMERDFENETGS